VHGDILFRSTILAELNRSFQNFHPHLGIAVSGRKYIAPTHARIEYDDNFVVQDIKSSALDIDVWMGVDACHPDLIDTYCGEGQTSQGELAKHILAHQENIVAVPYPYSWTHIVTSSDLYKAQYKTAS